MAITIVEDAEIRRINREYRATDRVTDVISFAIEDEHEELHGFTAVPRDIGDLFIAPGKVREQAKDYGIASSASWATPSFTASYT